jgi:hypothetical protein
MCGRGGTGERAGEGTGEGERKAGEAVMGYFIGGE